LELLQDWGNKWETLADSPVSLDIIMQALDAARSQTLGLLHSLEQAEKFPFIPYLAIAVRRPLTPARCTCRRTLKGINATLRRDCLRTVSRSGDRSYACRSGLMTAMPFS